MPVPMNGMQQPQSAAMQDSALPPMMQMIAVPVGETPPEGAIPVPMDMVPSADGPVASQPTVPPQQSKRAFKIKDPRTGLEVQVPKEGQKMEKGAWRITNPKTGEEVRPNY